MDAARWFTRAVNPWLSICTVVKAGLQSEGRDDALRPQNMALNGEEAPETEEIDDDEDILGSMCAYMHLIKCYTDLPV